MTDAPARAGAPAVVVRAGPEAAALVAAPLGTPARPSWRRYRRSPAGVAGALMVSVVALTALLAPLLAPTDPRSQDLLHTLRSPSAAHWLGTDQLGRDQLSRVIYGSRPALLAGLGSVPIALVIALVLGSVAGYLGRHWDSVVMRVADVFFAFPSIIGAIVVVLIVGRGLPAVILAMGIFGWATMARVLRSSILVVREAAYVEASRAAGAGSWWVVTRHVLPNCLGTVLVLAAAKVGTAVLVLSSLSFLGVGIQPDSPDWGSMVASGHDFFGVKDYLWICPSVALAFTVLAFVLVGDGLRDALDPRA